RRADVADIGEEEGRQDLLVGEALLDAGGDLLEQPLARRLFKELDEGLEAGARAHRAPGERGLGQAHAGEKAGQRRHLEKAASIDHEYLTDDWGRRIHRIRRARGAEGAGLEWRSTTRSRCSAAAGFPGRLPELS